MKKGSLVEVKFLDHCMGGKPSDPVVCLAYGEVFEEDETILTLRFWNSLEDDDTDNDEFLKIIKGAILEIHELTYKNP